MRYLTLLLASSIVVFGQGLAYTFNSNGFATLTYNGVSFLDPSFAEFSPNSGVFGGATVSWGGCSKSSSASGFEWHCNIGASGDTTFTVTVAGAGTDTLSIETCAKNEDSLSRSLTSSNFYQLTNLTFPSAVTSTCDDPNCQMGYTAQGVAAQYNWATGSLTLSQNNFAAWGQWVYANSGYRVIPSVTAAIAPGATSCGTMYAKWGAAGAYIAGQALTQYQAWWAAYPTTLRWPDRRMVWSDFIATSWTNRSATNPYAYCSSPTFDAFNATDLQNCLTTRANAIIAKIADYESTYGIKSQGVILWDLEGFEFTHATTYQGEPRAFSNGYSPVGAVLNNVLNVYKAAGLRVGFTIRPQLLTYVNALPPTCTYNADPEINDTVIVYSAAWEEKFYVCESGGVSWDGPYPEGNGYQRAYGSSDDATITALLAAKIQHSIDTYGASLFYMDSNVYPGGTAINANVMSALQVQFPNVLIFPESGGNAYYQYTSGFSDLSNIPGAYGVTPVNTTRLYPTAFRFNKMQDCSGSCWTTKETSVREGFAVGDVMSTWIFAHPDTFSNLGSAWQYVLANYKKVIVTDSVSGSSRVYEAAPQTSFTYPLVMRVYFASSSGGLNASTLYCVAGRNQNLGGTLGDAAFNGSNACTINLTGMTHSQIRYYTFSGDLVSEGPSAQLQ